MIGLEGRHLWVPPERLAEIAVPDDLPHVGARTNLCTNPKGAVDTAGWVNSGLSAFAIDSSVVFDMFPLADIETGFVAVEDTAGDNAQFPLDLVSGHTYHFSAYLNVGAGPIFRFEVRDPGGTLKGNSASASGGGWLRRDFGVTADSTGTWTFRFVCTTHYADVPVSAYFSGVLIEESSLLGTYFDGDTQGAAWTGEPNASTSEDQPVPLALNYRTDDNGDPVWPRYELKRIGGLHGLADSGDRRDKRVGVRGEIPRRSFRGGKTLTYEGMTQAQSRADLRDAEQALRDAFDDQSDEGLMVATPHPLYSDAGEFDYFNARAIACDIDDVVGTSPHRPSMGHESSFVVSLRSKDGSYFDQDGNEYR